MSHPDHKVPKQENGVTLWLHPEGEVAGSNFLSDRAESMEPVEPVEPVEVLNEPAPFLVLRRKDGEIRIYNKASIARVEYQGQGREIPENVLRCVLQMKDGSRIEGTISRFLPPDKARLHDFLNHDGERFIKVCDGPHDVCLVNKVCIVQAAPV